MSGIVGHVVRRGLDAASRLEQAEDNLRDFKMSPQAKAAIFATFFGMLAVLFSIRYTYGEVVATLATVETPTASIIAEERLSDEPDAPLLSGDGKQSIKEDVAADLMVIKNKPITSKLLTTIRHLRARAGILSRYRGISAWACYHFAVFHLSNFIARIFGSVHSPIHQGIGAVVAAVALASVNMTWTHIVISDPSSKLWFRRVLGRKAWLKVAPATFIFAMAEQLTIVLPVLAFYFSDLPTAAKLAPGYFKDIDCAQHRKLVLQAFGVALTGFLTALLVLVPASVTLTRVQASMLPEEYESIVPFDRSFGGKVVPEIVGGSGMIGLLDAWKTFNWAARFRLMKVYVKVAVMQIAVTIGFMGILAAEMRYILGDRLDDLAFVAKAHMKGE